MDKGAFHGINITKQTDGTKKYELFKIQDRDLWRLPTICFLFHVNEIQKNDLLEQNPGYDKIGRSMII